VAVSPVCISLLPVLYSAVLVVQTAKVCYVLDYGPYGLCISPSRGPCKATIFLNLLVLEEHTGIISYYK
jgi:hypothetical protein